MFYHLCSHSIVSLAGQRPMWPCWRPMRQWLPTILCVLSTYAGITFVPSVHLHRLPQPGASLGYSPAMQRSEQSGSRGSERVHQPWVRSSKKFIVRGTHIGFPGPGNPTAPTNPAASSQFALGKPVNGRKVAKTMKDGTKLCASFQQGHCKAKTQCPGGRETVVPHWWRTSLLVPMFLLAKPSSFVVGRLYLWIGSLTQATTSPMPSGSPRYTLSYRAQTV